MKRKGHHMRWKGNINNHHPMIGAATRNVLKVLYWILKTVGRRIVFWFGSEKEWSTLSVIKCGYNILHQVWQEIISDWGNQQRFYGGCSICGGFEERSYLDMRQREELREGPCKRREWPELEGYGHVSVGGLPCSKTGWGWADNSRIGWQFVLEAAKVPRCLPNPNRKLLLFT